LTAQTTESCLGVRAAHSTANICSSIDVIKHSTVMLMSLIRVCVTCFGAPPHAVAGVSRRHEPGRHCARLGAETHVVPMHHLLVRSAMLALLPSCAASSRLAVSSDNAPQLTTLCLLFHMRLPLQRLASARPG
jgi:hypothetical protein